MQVSRRQVIVAGVAAAFPQAAYALDGDMTIGNINANVRLVEYASLTCPHCAHFHAEEFPRLKAEYIDTNRIAFTLREYPTAPPQIAFAMFQLARTGGPTPDLYFTRVAELFREQQNVLATGTGAGVRDALFRIGHGWGLTEEQILASMQDEAAVDRIGRAIEAGNAVQIRGTPAFVVNDRLLSTPPTYDALSAALNEALRA